MPGPTTTGKPKTDDYNLGRGILYFAPIDAVSGRPKDFRDLGNAPAFTITSDTETLQHFSSRSGLKTLDKEVTISRAMSAGFSLDEWNNNNLADLLSGALSSDVNSAVLGFTQWQPVADGDVVPLRHYELRNSAGLRSYDVSKADVTIKTTNATPVTLVLGTDYEVNEQEGTYFLLGTAAVALAVTNVEGLTVVLAAKGGAAATIHVVDVQTRASVVGALKFVSENAVDGSKIEFTFHQVTLKAEGDLSLIGDEWGEMTFTSAAEENVLSDANSPTLTIKNIPAAA